MNSRLSARLEYDIKHLLWRSDVYGLAAEDVRKRFEQIKREYLQITPPADQGLLIRQFDEWQLFLAEHANQRRSHSLMAMGS